MQLKLSRRFVRMLAIFVLGLGMAACTNISQEGNGNICANNASCTQGGDSPAESSVQADASSNVGNEDANSGQSSPSSGSQSSQDATEYQQVPFGTLCQYPNSNNFFNSCPGGNFSAELGGRVYTFMADTLVGLPQEIAEFTNSTCKSLSLRMGILPDPNADYPSNLQITVTLVQGNRPPVHVTVPLDRLVTWSVTLTGPAWDLDGSANNTNFGWPLLMDGTALCSTPTGVTGGLFYTQIVPTLASAAAQHPITNLLPPQPWPECLAVKFLSV